MLTNNSSCIFELKEKLRAHVLKTGRDKDKMVDYTSFLTRDTFCACVKYEPKSAKFKC